MAPTPRLIAGAKVVCFTVIDQRHRQTGQCRQIVAGVLQEPAAGLAICQYEGEGCYFLFRCDSAWECVTDTWHLTVEDAKIQAEFEYTGSSETWQLPA